MLFPKPDSLRAIYKQLNLGYANREARISLLFRIQNNGKKRNLKSGSHFNTKEHI